MGDKIVDIYNLNNLKTDCNYFTMKITFDNDKIYSLEIDGETHNKNKIDINYYNKNIIILDLYKILEDYGFDNQLFGIKFKIHNINLQITYISYHIYEESVYDGEIVIDNIINHKFKIEFRKILHTEKITGYIQLNIYELINILPLLPNKYNETLKILNNLYILNLDTQYFKINKNFVNLDIKNRINKVIKKYELPFYQKNIEGTVQIECYSNCSKYFYYIITRIVYNGTIIETIQNNKCNCDEYNALDFIKTESIFYNREKKCRCFLTKLYKLLKELKIESIFIKKNDILQNLNLKEMCEIMSYFKM